MTFWTTVQVEICVEGTPYLNSKVRNGHHITQSFWTWRTNNNKKIMMTTKMMIQLLLLMMAVLFHECSAWSNFISGTRDFRHCGSRVDTAVRTKQHYTCSYNFHLINICSCWQLHDFLLWVISLPRLANYYSFYKTGTDGMCYCPANFFSVQYFSIVIFCYYNI